MTITVGSPLVQTCAQVFWMDVVRHTACRSAPSHGKCVSGPSAVFVGARPPTAVDGSCHCHGRAVCQCVCVCVTSWSVAPCAVGSGCRRPSLLCTLFAQHTCVISWGEPCCTQQALGGAVVCAHGCAQLVRGVCARVAAALAAYCTID